jgi:rod shape-determining protein MreC
VQAGDIVTTNGLDGIFFANIPVGVVEKVSTEDNYKVAKVKYYANPLTPGTFSVIKDAGKKLVYDFNIDKVKASLAKDKKEKIIPKQEELTVPKNTTDTIAPKIYQTQEDSIHPTVENGEETQVLPPKAKPKSSPLEMF